MYQQTHKNNNTLYLVRQILTITQHESVFQRDNNNDNTNQETETGVRGSEQANQDKEGRKQQGFHKRQIISQRGD